MAITAQNTNNTTIRSEGKLVHLEQPLAPLPYHVVSQAARDAYDTLLDVQNEVACLMLGSMSPELQRTLKNYKAYDMIQELKTMFEEQAKNLILNSLNKDYDQFIQNYNMHNKGKTLAELHVMLKLHEKGAKGKAKGKNKLAYAPKTKISPPPKRDNSAKGSICHHCKEVGHWRRNCPSYHAELKKRKNASVASTSGLRESRKLKHGALSLHINKKRIDMLQRDGLLQPTHDESHEKCKSCISEKMARKPFPHQMERAKDLLGLIHTDVCGPFRNVSREGANYFITFTDDFSRYGFVYLIWFDP
ncbi:retrotransposon protein, putative, ty1-copia subclass [Tanacetum coccineum]